MAKLLLQVNPRIALFPSSNLLTPESRPRQDAIRLERALANIGAVEVRIVDEPQRPRERLVVVASSCRLNHGAVLGVGTGQSEGHAVVVARNDPVDQNQYVSRENNWGMRHTHQYQLVPLLVGMMFQRTLGSRGPRVFPVQGPSLRVAWGSASLGVSLRADEEVLRSGYVLGDHFGAIIFLAIVESDVASCVVGP